MVKKSDEDSSGGDDEAERTRKRRAKKTFTGLWVLGGFAGLGIVFLVIVCFIFILSLPIDILSFTNY